MRANLSYYSKSVPTIPWLSSWLNKHKAATSDSEVIQGNAKDVHRIHHDKSKRDQEIDIDNDFEQTELQNQKRFGIFHYMYFHYLSNHDVPFHPSDAKFASENEIVKRFNAQVAAGIIKPILECIDLKELKVVTVLETVIEYIAMRFIKDK